MQRIERLRGRMNDAQLDVMVLTHPDDVLHSTELLSPR